MRSEGKKTIKSHKTKIKRNIFRIDRNGEMEKWRNGEMEKWRNGEMEKWRNGEMEKWRNGEMEKWGINKDYFLTCMECKELVRDVSTWM
jgi:hypothetical protein